MKNDYGMTESGGPFMCLSKEDEKFKSSGKVLPWISWKVVDVETGKKLGPNQYGELWGKGPTIFKVWPIQLHVILLFNKIKINVYY